MHIVKLFLRNEGGDILSALTLREDETGVSLPKGITPILATDEAGVPMPICITENGVLYPRIPSALLLRKGEEMLYAFAENGETFALRKWKLLSCLPEESSTHSLSVSAEISEEKEEENIPVSVAPPAGATDVPPAEKKNKLSKILELFARGEPFLGFEKVIEGSKWVRMPDEDYLIGILEEGGETLVLYGVPGRLGEAPDDTCDWTFLPVSEENEEWGYYICKSTDLE